LHSTTANKGFADVKYMKKIFYLSLTCTLLFSSPFETQKEKSFDLSVFDTKSKDIHKKAMENEKVKCRKVCDKKIYKEQKIADAISFYKKTL